MKLSDPGKGKSRAAAKAARLQAWKKPEKTPDQDDLRAVRIADWERVNGTRFSRQNQL